MSAGLDRTEPFETVNEYGTPITVFPSCVGCGQESTVCPALPPERVAEWAGCLGEQCSTYDLSRDIDLFWEALSDHGQIKREAT